MIRGVEDLAEFFGSHPAPRPIVARASSSTGVKLNRKRSLGSDGADRGVIACEPHLDVESANVFQATIRSHADVEEQGGDSKVVSASVSGDYSCDSKSTAEPSSSMVQSWCKQELAPESGVGVVTSLAGGGDWTFCNTNDFVAEYHPKRQGRGGRLPAVDPRLDPNIDPKRAKRILANRQSAAKSKQKQRLLGDTLKRQQESLLRQKNRAAEEYKLLLRACEELEASNALLCVKVQELRMKREVAPPNVVGTALPVPSCSSCCSAMSKSCFLAPFDDLLVEPLVNVCAPLPVTSKCFEDFTGGIDSFLDPGISSDVLDILQGPPNACSSWPEKQEENNASVSLNPLCPVRASTITDQAKGLEAFAYSSKPPLLCGTHNSWPSNSLPDMVREWEALSGGFFGPDSYPEAVWTGLYADQTLAGWASNAHYLIPQKLEPCVPPCM